MPILEFEPSSSCSTTTISSTTGGHDHVTAASPPPASSSSSSSSSFSTNSSSSSRPPPPPPHVINTVTLIRSSSSMEKETSTVHAEQPPAAAIANTSASQSPNQQLPPFLRQSLHLPITLKFEDLAYSSKLQHSTGSQAGQYCFSSSDQESKRTRRTVLSGVSGVVRPGELLAMLGPSGSGKTTLLTALATGGKTTTATTTSGVGGAAGTITYSGQPFSSSVKRKIGFVTQDDVLYPHLTVLETLTYAAMLRLPNNLTHQQKLQQAELIIIELGLTRCRNSIIGGSIIRGVSGGERKRVSIGQEMLVNPSLLLLDEPTSGLDSTTALRLMTTLKGLAKGGGRSVVTTIHQPSSRLYWMFDKVVVLCDQGCPIFSGDAGRVMEYFASIGYVPGFNLINPADFLLDLANGVAPNPNGDDQKQYYDQSRTEDSIKQHLISSYKKTLHPLILDDIRRRNDDDVHDHPISTRGRPKSSRCCDTNRWATSWWTQFKVLFKRGLRERKHESYSGLRIFQVMSVSILSGLLWWHSHTSHLQDQVGLLFFFSIFWGFYPLSNAIFTFPQERPMLIRERSSGMYRLSSYFFARMAGDLPMELVLPTMFVTATYWMGGLKPSLITFLLTLVIILFNVLVSQGLGLALGAILMDLKQATTLSSVIMLVFLLAGGYYIQQIPPFISWLKYISFSHYCYKLLVEVQYSENEVYECGGGLQYCRVLDFPGIKYLGIGHLWCDVAALGAMLVGYRLLAYLALRMTKSISH